ncbi:MAG TPA: methylenetetrahydromethanopterin dehydrogenase, partial [Chloroflexi bacterium]|nr:methylenetetrahydromethanopterin dehydrogenase [Chloroflexota bacterium]
MNKILLQLDSDKHPSVFDAITAYDAGADHVLTIGGVAVEDVRALVYGAMFTRGGDELKNSAVFIGGSDVAVGEAMLKAATEAFFGPVRVSVMMDANGCNTTAAAAVAKMVAVGDVTGQKVVILA